MSNLAADSILKIILDVHIQIIVLSFDRKLTPIEQTQVSEKLLLGFSSVICMFNVNHSIDYPVIHRISVLFLL